jgi:hypothetical protein
MDVPSISVSTRQIKPIIDMFTKEELKYFCPETNIRTVTTFKYKQPKENSKEEYDINFARNQIFKFQYKVPMKYLQPETEYFSLKQDSTIVNKPHTFINFFQNKNPSNCLG